MRGVSADGRPLSVEWYFVPDDRGFVPFYNRFSSLNYSEGQEGDTALGEDPETARPWWNGKFDRTADKDTPCGSEEVWQRGYQDDDPTSTTTRTGESACCTGQKGGLMLGGGMLSTLYDPLVFAGSSRVTWFHQSTVALVFTAATSDVAFHRVYNPVEGLALALVFTGPTSDVAFYPALTPVEGEPLDLVWAGESDVAFYPALTPVEGEPVDNVRVGSSEAVYVPVSVEVDCCPGSPIPTHLQASFVEANEACWFGVTIPITWDGTAWVGTGTVGTCGYDLTLTFQCVPGGIPGTFVWQMYALSSTLCVDGLGPDPFAVSCAPLSVKFALGAGVWIGACSAQPILAGWIEVAPVP